MTHWGQHSHGTAGSTDTTGASGQTVGFRYLMGTHMGFCRGPIDEVCEFRVGDRTAWAGSVVLNQDIDIDAYDLFGGEGGEGGVKGTMTFMFGADDQVCPDNLGAMLDTIKLTNGTVSAETIAIDNQTIIGIPGDAYVGIKTDDLGFVYATYSSQPPVKLNRPWNLNAPLYDPAHAQPGKVNPAMNWNIRFHLDTGSGIPFTDGLGMAFNIYYSMSKPREMRLVAPGEAKLLITIETTSGVVVDTAAVTLQLA